MGVVLDAHFFCPEEHATTFMNNHSSFMKGHSLMVQRKIERRNVT